MDTIDTELPLELQTAIDRAEKKDQRAVKAAGYGASDLGMHLTKGYIGYLSDYLRDQIDNPQRGSTIEDALRIIGNLSPEVLALCGLNACLHGVAVGMLSTELFAYAGYGVSAEAWSAGLTKHDAKLSQRIERAARNRASTVAHRRQAARMMARKEYEVKHWSRKAAVHVGTWLVGLVVSALPQLFEWITEELPTSTHGKTKTVMSLAIVANAYEAAVTAIGEAINPIYLPVTTPPKPWTGWRMEHVDPRVGLNTTVLRTHYGDVAAACRAAIKDGTMKPVLDGLSSLQGVPYRINKRIHGVIRGCIENGIAVAGLPASSDIPEVTHEKPWADMTDLERKQFKVRCVETERENRSLRGQRVGLEMDMSTAERLANQDRFWTPMNCDWRGRVYSTCHFNFQRDDRVRALFEFADGEPIGEEGLWWLKVHVANCGDFSKVSKRPLEERVQWVDDNMQTLAVYAELPLKELGWTKADKPFLFLAACMELLRCVCSGPTTVSHLPVSFDGSCSGLQHLAAMTRDEETAALVNLKPSAEPADVYASIAETVVERLKADNDPMAETFLAHGVTRKVCKRNVMTYSYSSKKHGMAGQQQVDLMDPLSRDVLMGKLSDHPFAPYHRGSKELPGKAARFIASHTFDAIEQRIHRPALAMKFLQGVARAMAHEGKPVIWTTPTGLPWINRYHKPRTECLRLWLHDRGVRVPIRSIVSVGSEKEIDKDRAANGVAPNFVHALDAAHLILTVNSAVEEGITNIATVHDSFGCLASRARRFNQIIREQFVRMYETHDVLSEVLERSKCDLTQHNVHRLPNVPEYGTLNLKEIEHAPFAFA